MSAASVTSSMSGDVWAASRQPLLAASSPNIIVLAHRDAETTALAIKRLLDAEERYATVLFGLEVAAYTLPNPAGVRIVAVWSGDSIYDVGMIATAERALKQNALVEVKVGDTSPKIDDRQYPPLEFANWNQTRAGEWNRFVDRLNNQHHREIVTSGHVKYAAATLIAASGLIFVPAVATRALEAGLSDPAATSIVAPIIDGAQAPPVEVTAHPALPLRLDGPQAAAEEAFTPIAAARPIRMSRLPSRTIPRIAALESAEPLIQVEIRRRSIVGQILAAADNLPLMPDEPNQSN